MYMNLYLFIQESPKRVEFVQKITGLMTKMIQNYSPVDAACDQMGKQYIIDSLPPMLSDGWHFITDKLFYSSVFICFPAVCF